MSHKGSLGRISARGTPSPKIIFESTIESPVHIYKDPEASKDNKRAKHVTDIIGDHGPWQRSVCFFHTAINLFSAINAFSLFFYAPETDYWCANEQSSLNIRPNLKSFNGTITAHPLNPSTSLSLSSRSIDRCDCKKWEYNSTMRSNIISEWDLVCDRAWLASFSQSVYMLGVLASAVICSPISDRYGRRLVHRFGMFLEVFAGVSSALSTSIWHFILSRFCLAFGTYTRGFTGFVMILESVGPKSRAFWGLAENFGWGFGYMILPILAYQLRHFRRLQLFCTAMEIPFLLFYWWIPESPKWLLTQGARKRDQLNSMIKKIVKINKVKIVESDLQRKLVEIQEHAQEERNHEANIKAAAGREPNLLDILRTPKLRRTLLIMYLSWIVHGFIYYGISLNVDKFGGDMYLSFFIAALVDFPTSVFPMIAIKYFNRRSIVAFLLFFNSVACLMAAILQAPRFYQHRMAIGMIAKLAIGGSYTLVYMMSGEVFPTVLRQTAMGSCSAVGRLGSILAPFTRELITSTSLRLVLGIFFLLSIADGFLVLWLPETKDKEIPDTLKEAENLDKERDSEESITAMINSSIELISGTTNVDAGRSSKISREPNNN